MKYIKTFESIDFIKDEDERRAIIDRISKLLDWLDDRKILDKVTDHLNKDPDRTYDILFTKDENNGVWVYHKINLPSRDTVRKYIRMGGCGGKLLRKILNTILSIVNVGDIMKKINEGVGEFTLDKLIKLLDQLSKNGILDKVVKKLLDTGKFHKFNYIKNDDDQWCMSIDRMSASIGSYTETPFSEMNIEMVERNYDQILDLVNVGDVMKKINASS